MNTYVALVKREFLEHRAAFLYAPAVLMLVVFGFLAAGMMFGRQPEFEFDFAITNRANVFDFMVLVLFGAWSVYLLLALFFYYSDSFNSDRRNNALLFWKSMPQSDFKILMSKSLTGLTLFPVLILGFAAISGVLAYFLTFILAFKLPIFEPVSFATAIWTVASTTIVAGIYFFVAVLWYAPLLAWVAGLSTLVGRWSIPLAFLIPLLVVGMERMLTFGQSDSMRPIANYLDQRFDSLPPTEPFFENMIFSSDFNVWSIVAELFRELNYVDLGLGLAFTFVVIYLASEFRRRSTAS